MEKKLNRQIGYKPPKKSPDPTIVIVKPKKVKPPVTIELVSKPSTAQDIIAWIKAHPHFKWFSMCRELGIDGGNFKRTMDAECPVIKPENILKIEKNLMEYGYLKK